MPEPLPTPLVVKNGSKARSSTSWGMPTPVSVTVDADVVARAKAARLALLRIHGVRLDREQAAIRHRVARIQHEVQDRGLEQAAVDIGGLARRGMRFERDVVAERTVEYLGERARSTSPRLSASG